MIDVGNYQVLTNGLLLLFSVLEPLIYYPQVQQTILVLLMFGIDHQTLIKCTCMQRHFFVDKLRLKYDNSQYIGMDEQ